MSAIDPTALPHGHPEEHGHAHGHEGDAHGHSHAHPPHLAHHFDTPEQQFDSAKLGMWAFLATEVLMFGGLFCAYAVYRYNHPNVFRYGEHHVNTMWGAINTIILLTSSLTMAMGVRAAQLGQRAVLVAMLVATLLGGAGFMVIKAIEYNDKFDHGLFPGVFNSYDRVQNPEGFQRNVVAHMATGEPGTEDHGPQQPVHGTEQAPPRAVGDHPEGPGPYPAEQAPTGAQLPGQGAAEPHAQDPATQGAAATGTQRQAPGEGEPGQTPALAQAPRGVQLSHLGPQYTDPNYGTGDAAIVRPTFRTNTGLAAPVSESHQGVAYTDLTVREQTHVKAFFNIYFMMTGLHGLHVLIGIGLILWITVRASAFRHRRPILALAVVGVAAYLVVLALLTDHTAPTFSTAMWWGAGIVGLLGLGWLVIGIMRTRSVPAGGGDFGPEYFTPVDLVGLYWHLVDLIWIFLFPLLYLIH